MLKGVSKTNKNKTKEHKEEFLSMLLVTLGASLLGNMLAGKGLVRPGYGKKKENGVIAKRQGRGTVRAAYGSEMDF